MIFWELFYNFFLIGLFTFGGGYAMIPMITDTVVSKGWCTSSAITDFIAISEMTPGPFAINIATFVGNTTAGIGGAVCTTIGVILPSFIIILIIAMILKRFMKNRFVKAGITGVQPTVIALICSTVITFFAKAIFFNGGNINYSAVSFDVISLTLLIVILGIMIIFKKVTKKGLGPITILLISAALGIIIFI